MWGKTLNQDDLFLNALVLVANFDMHRLTHSNAVEPDTIATLRKQLKDKGIISVKIGAEQDV